MPQEFSEEKIRLENQVRWLDEQLIGHEKNFDIQFEKLQKADKLLEIARNDIQKNQAIHKLKDAKIAALSNYIAVLEQSGVQLSLKSDSIREIRQQSAVTAYEACAYKNAVEEVIQAVANSPNTISVMNILEILQEFEIAVDKERKRLTEEL